MNGGKLTPLQRRLVVLLADVTPPWILTGGAALGGFYTCHRGTRDLDLRWPDVHDLEDASRAVREHLAKAGVAYDVVQSSPTFERLRITGDAEVVLIDLVADPVRSIEPPAIIGLDGAQIRLDTEHEILVNKFCALLGRMELRDLQDVRELLQGGGNFEQALRDAPLKDGGFSPLMLSWILKGMPAGRLATSAGWSPADAEAIEQYKLALIDRLADAAASEIVTDDQ